MRLPFTVVSTTHAGDRHRGHRLLALLLGLALLAIAPMIARAQGTDTVLVSWTAPGDDGSFGTASVYDLRVSQSPITSANFASATAVSGVPAPLPAGTRQRVTVRGLTSGTTYYFAIRASDEASNWSEISNILRWEWTLDAAPPATPDGVSVERDADAARITWAANSDVDLVGYRVYRGSDAGGPFALLNENIVTETVFMDRALPQRVDRLWYRVTAVDANGNESAPSVTVALVLDETVAADATVELELAPGYPNPSSAGTPVRIPITVRSDQPSAAVVEVCDGAGRRIRSLDVQLTPGLMEVVWDGKNDAGREVAPGVYRACLIAGDTRSTVRLLRAP